MARGGKGKPKDMSEAFHCWKIDANLSNLITECLTLLAPALVPMAHSTSHSFTCFLSLGDEKNYLSEGEWTLSGKSMELRVGRGEVHFQTNLFSEKLHKTWKLGGVGVGSFS